MYSARTQEILKYRAAGWNYANIARQMHCDGSAIRFILDKVKRLEEYSNMSELYRIIIDAEEEPLAYILKLRRAHVVTIDEFLAINDENFKKIFTERMCGKAFLNKTKQLQQIVREKQ